MEHTTLSGFARAFVAHDCKRLPPLKGPDDFLAILKESEIKESFKSIEVEDGNFVFANSKK